MIIVMGDLNVNVGQNPLREVVGCHGLGSCKKCFSSFRNSTCYLENGVCDNSKSCDTCGQWFIGQVLEHICNLSYCSYCSKSVKPDHQCFIEVKNRSNV